MRFLFVGSHLCARASFRQALADLPLPSASGYPDSMMSSHRGLSPHKLMPMSGVHKAMILTVQQRRSACCWPAGYCRRWAAEHDVCSLEDEVMAKCAACESLEGAKQSTPAHSALRSISQEKYKTFGWHTGHITQYRCSDCGAKWQLDRDKQDAHAGWTELNE